MAQNISEMWQQRVECWRLSGLSAREYAKQEGFSASTLYNWAAKLSRKQDIGEVENKPGVEKERAARREGGPCTQNLTQASFVEIPAIASSAAAMCIEISIGESVRLRVPSGVDDRTLACVIRALGVGQ